MFPLLWLAYTLIRGPIVEWYPYPFVDVITHGYRRVTVNAMYAAVSLVGRRPWPAGLPPRRDGSAAASTAPFGSRMSR